MADRSGATIDSEAGGSRASVRLRAALIDAERLSASLAMDRGQALCERDDIGRGLLWLGRSPEIADRIDDPDLWRGSRKSLEAWSRKVHPLREILTHEAVVSAMALSPDGTMAVIGCDDGSVRLWDTATARPVGSPLRQPGRSRIVAFSRDGAAILNLGGPLDGGAGLLPTSMMGWYFEGSLTTPPLSQVVNWLVFATPITMDATQLAEYQQVADDDGFVPNARPSQAIDGRQLNEIDFDVNFQVTSITALTFVDGPAGSSTAAVRHGTHADADTSASAATPASRRGSASMAATLPVLQGNPALQAAAAAQNDQPVAVCNCPLCQMFRNAVWHEVTLNSGTQNVGAALAGGAGAAASQSVTSPPSSGRTA
jgi:hypothetical protein